MEMHSIHRVAVSLCPSISIHVHSILRAQYLEMLVCLLSSQRMKIASNPMWRSARNWYRSLLLTHHCLE